MPIPIIYLKIVLEIVAGTKHKSNCRLIAKREEAFFLPFIVPGRQPSFFPSSLNYLGAHSRGVAEKCCCLTPSALSLSLLQLSICEDIKDFSSFDM